VTRLPEPPSPILKVLLLIEEAEDQLWRAIRLVNGVLDDVPADELDQHEFLLDLHSRLLRAVTDLVVACGKVAKRP
jgi:hypothetical protein